VACPACGFINPVTTGSVRGGQHLALAAWTFAGLGLAAFLLGLFLLLMPCEGFCIGRGLEFFAPAFLGLVLFSLAIGFAVASSRSR
jgi:hypothetical protein